LVEVAAMVALRRQAARRRLGRLGRLATPARSVAAVVVAAGAGAVAHPTQAPMALAPLAELVALGPLDSS
jgi:aspartate carbamoyltransferase catalytic subunit